MVDRAALEMQCTARYRGFESLSLRQMESSLAGKWASWHVGKGLSLSDEVAPLFNYKLYTTPCHHVTVSPYPLIFNWGEAL